MRVRLVAMALALGVVITAQPCHAKDTPTEGRTWWYASATGILGKHWGYTVMPGMRHEFSDSAGDSGGVVMYELFTGPVFITKLGPVSFKLPLWYYYMGFPIKEKDDYFSSHNLELVPIFSYGRGNWEFLSRTIFHNKLYADNSVFTTDSQRQGYSLLIRQMLRVGYKVAPKLTVHVADELFVGLVEDSETSDLAKGEPFFEKGGFSMNRVYVGAGYGIGGGSSVIPQYILETHHDPDNGSELTKVRHYLFVTLKFATQIF
jgi:hypothetical protein